jgi:peroxiredoxin (alkyl hydroperoxide reductase subunit C)
MNTLAPDFALRGGDERPRRLSEYRGGGVVLVFYPADWSPVCSSELSLIQEALPELRGYNAEVFAISVDGPYSHRAWAEHLGLKFPLLSDFWPHGAVARAYGVFREDEGTSERALFFIDGAGVIRDAWVAEDPGIAPSLGLIFDALERLNAARGAEGRHV